MTRMLHGFRDSGDAHKRALAPAQMETPRPPAFVDVFHGATRRPAFRAPNPMGAVPVPVDGDLTLSQSGAMLLHMARRKGRLGDPAGPEIPRRILRDNHRLWVRAGALRFPMNVAPEERRDPAVIAFLQGRVKAACTTLNDHLTGRDWNVGRYVTVADLSCCGYLWHPEPFGLARADWPRIALPLDRIAGLPGWRHPYHLMPGNPGDRAP